ncbi:TMEM243 [Branchiostoma lanceolatum]|uniref:TMEM243 protein n=1 Tax=Branchiostoma lanceolatum TaxID=7740 RepID=A0A8K0A0D3_BRALA|nr:TMEM243 [Branchiostoma lanceolatum]
MLSRNQYSRIGQDEEGDVNKPLFGESRPQVTLVSAFIFPKWPPQPINLYFGVCVILTCISNIILIFWYRKGDIDPKFRSLIYYNAFVILVLCVCANLYFHGVK